MFILSKFDDCSFLPRGSNGRGGATDHKMLAMLDLREFERPENSLPGFRSLRIDLIGDDGACGWR